MSKKLFNELNYLQERMHRRSKKVFREYLKSKAEKYNLDYNIFPNTFIAKNVVIGNLKKAKYVLGAHYDTPPRMPAFLMKSVLFFNIATCLIVVFSFVLMFIFDIFLLIFAVLYIYLLFYLLGFGISNKYNYNDNTSGVLTVLSLMEKNRNQDVAYVFFDNEEKGLLGSIQLAIFMKRLKSYHPRKKIFINFDCVGIGNVFGIASFKNKRVAQELIDLSNNYENGNLLFEHRKASPFEGSDHFAFRNWNSLGIMCYNKKKKKYILKNIHSHKDKYIDLENIIVLVNLINNYIDMEVVSDGRV